MRINQYEKLKNISIEKSGIIKNSISDPIYKFCVLNKVDNLGDFIVTYNKERSNMDRRCNFSYFDGIIDLINLIFFKENLIESELLSKKIKIFKNESPKTVFAYVEGEAKTCGQSENYTLKRLGFNNKEAKEILREVLIIGNQVSIIDAINSCIENFKYKNMSVDNEMFLTKLFILSKYYEENKDEFKTLTSYEYNKAKEDIKKLKTLYRKISLIEKEIIEVSCHFEDMANKLPQNEEKVKKLIKEYQDFVCK